MRKRLEIIGIFLVIILTLSNISISVFGDNFTAKRDQINNKEFIESSEEIYDLLILAPSKFTRALCPLVTHKNNLKVKTILVELSDVYSQLIENGRDNAEKIKYFIKQALDKWDIKYVLLVGGRNNHFSAFENWLLPARYSHIEDNVGSAGFFEYKFISDLYYADIYDNHGNFSSWDSNGNGIFGEWLADKPADDIPDLYPDVYVGRLPCRNIFEVRIVVNKIINYEKEKCSDSWFRNMVVIGGDSTCTDDDHYEGEYSNQLAIENMPGFNHIRLWTSWGTFTKPMDVIKAINYGCGFLYFAGHGSPRTWRTHPPKDNKTWIIGLELHHMFLLSNKEKLPICIVGGCLNSMFNISIFHSSWTFGIPAPECWSWRLTRKIGGGAIAVIGNTGIGYGPEYRQDPSIWAGEDWLEVHFFEEYGKNGTRILGEIWGKTIASYLDHFPIKWHENAFNDSALDAKTVEQWVLIGDPSLKIGGNPKNIAVSNQFFLNMFERFPLLQKIFNVV
jgi:hypothetical protein